MIAITSGEFAFSVEMGLKGILDSEIVGSGIRAAPMCFKITFAQREFYRYRGISAELERRGRGASTPELNRANRLDREQYLSTSDPVKKSEEIPASPTIKFTLEH